MKLKTIPALASLLLLGAAAAGHCDLIKSGTTYHRDFLAYDTSGTNLTGAAVGTFTVQQSVAGAAPVTITPTITYKANGHFDLVYTPALDSTPGSSALIITASGATQVDLNDQVVGFDPASDLGAAALATANTGIISLTARPAQTGDTFGLVSPLIAAGKLTAAALSNVPGSGNLVLGDFPSGQAPLSTYLVPTLTHNGSSQPVLIWTADSTATGYLVCRSADNRASYQVIATVSSSTLTYTDTTRPATGTVYYHVVPIH